MLLDAVSNGNTPSLQYRPSPVIKMFRIDHSWIAAMKFYVEAGLLELDNVCLSAL
jgi:hypothetical protein